MLHHAISKRCRYLLCVCRFTLIAFRIQEWKEFLNPVEIKCETLARGSVSGAPLHS